MKEGIENIMGIINLENNPMILATNLSFFISNAMKQGDISLYEAYMLNGEEVKLRRKGYKQPAWQGKVRISTCLNILNQKLTAQIFNDFTAAKMFNEWGLEAYHLNEERRSHYVLDRYTLFLDAYDSRELLQLLLDVRKNYIDLTDDDGPYHTEVFPYHYFSPEKIILDKMHSEYEKTLSDDVESLIVELSQKY